MAPLQQPTPNPQRRSQTGEAMVEWTKRRVPDLRAELKEKLLPDDGRKRVLIERLKFADGGILHTPAGRKLVYEQGYQQQLDSIPPFKYFSQFPPEIRDLIWEFSLPGPRVLRMKTRGAPSIDTDKLLFPKRNRTPNPAALSLCRRSRAIALQRYKLCFGTPDVYADLSGGDVLYFEPDHIIWDWVSFPDENDTPGQAHSLSATVRTDLASVKHVAVSYQQWISFAKSPTPVVLGRGNVLRRQLGELKGVERVSMSMAPENGLNEVFDGYATIEDPNFDKPPKNAKIQGNCGFDSRLFRGIDPEVSKAWKKRRREIADCEIGARVLSSFDLINLTAEERDKGVPEARIVDLKFVPYSGPPRLRELECPPL